MVLGIRQVVHKNLLLITYYLQLKTYNLQLITHNLKLPTPSSTHSLKKLTVLHFAKNSI